jgi:hypothetical protein
LYGYRLRCRTNRACEHFAFVKILERFSRHDTSLTALPRESSRVAGINLVVEGHCFMSFDGAKDQTLCAPAYLAVGKPDCQCCSFYIRTSSPAGRIDASARSEKATEIQAKRQGLLPLGLMKNQTYTAVRPANIPFRRSGLLYRISYGFFIHPESFRGRPADRAGSRTRPGEAWVLKV